MESNGLRDESAAIAAKNALIVGVSPDTPEKQSRFKQKFTLPFTLLADVDHKVAEAYGVWQEKSMYGRTYMGVARSTFIIDESGRIKAVFHKVKPDGHARQVLAAL